ncbi:uracil-DNA glycosylase [Natribacillus halophilus]|uniref:Type-4 uracil-DNA glycosylase n=1 Tax=Natribacillus halophilus TaxID=549003 RepID=A0A1G8KTG5_9BACI|nr:uracil-DNA glycosylase [Natribacillus halophilus]SDI46714.1 DNA polymerase [Natribacillus halophilus]
MEFPAEIIEQCQSALSAHQLEGFLTGAGNEDADIMFIGEAPGEKEAETGEPFSGRSGKILDSYLEALAITRTDVYITSVVRSRPYKWGERRPKGEPVLKKINRKPTAKEIFAHAPLLDYQITAIRPRIIVCLGGVAFKRLLGNKATLSTMHGKPEFSPVQKREQDAYQWSEETYTVFGLYHPAAVFYNPSIRQEIGEDLHTLKTVIATM